MLKSIFTVLGTVTVAFGLMVSTPVQAAQSQTVVGRVSSIYTEGHATTGMHYFIDRHLQLCGDNTPNWAFVNVNSSLTKKFQPLMEAAFLAGLEVEVSSKLVTVTEGFAEGFAPQYCEITSVRLNQD